MSIIMTAYKTIVYGLDIMIDIYDSDHVLYWIECNGKKEKPKKALIRESGKGLYFIGNFSGVRVRQYLHDFIRCN